MLTELSWTALKAFLIALVLTPIVRDIFRSYNVVDRPGRRKVHIHPIPRVGGIPIAIAYLVSLVSITNFNASLPAYDSPVWKLIPGAAVIFATGLIDDFFNLRPLYKLIGQIAGSVLVFMAGLRIEAIAGLSLPWWISLAITIFWLLLTTNALNLIDGLDGLCAGMGLLATLTLFGAALIQGNVPLAHATFPLAGALLGFLCYNFNPATVFLGDSGALLIGFLLGCYGMIWTQKTATLLSIVVPLLALTVPLLDVLLSVLRRFFRNQPIFGADRGHIHHRLLGQGLSVRRAVLTLYFASAIAAAFALMLSSPKINRYQVVIVFAFCAAVWAGIRQLRYSEFEVVSGLLFRGEVKRKLDQRDQVENLSSALKGSRTEEDWWDVLVQTSGELGWIRIAWLGIAPVRERFLLKENAAPTWTFSFPLSASESIMIEGPLSAGSTSPVRFAEVVSQSCAAKRQHWERLPAL